MISLIERTIFEKLTIGIGGQISGSSIQRRARIFLSPVQEDAFQRQSFSRVDHKD